MLSDAFDAMKGLIGDMPFVTMTTAPSIANGDASKKGEDATNTTTTTVTKNVVLSDGTYASITSTEQMISSSELEKLPHLRRHICQGDILLGTVASVGLTKLASSAKHLRSSAVNSGVSIRALTSESASSLKSAVKKPPSLACLYNSVP